MKKLVVLAGILFLCVSIPVSAQIKVNHYGAVYAGAYGNNPDAENPTFDIPGLYLHGSNDYPAMICKVGDAGYGIEIDGRGTNSGNLFRIIGGNSTLLIYASGRNSNLFSVDWDAKVNGNIFTGNNFITRLPQSHSTGSEMFKKIEAPLQKLMELNGILYRTSAPEENTNGKLASETASSRYRIGLRAEEVTKIVPEVVYTSQDGETGIAYNELIGLLIEAMKEQQATITEQQTTLEKMQSEITEMKSPSGTENITGEKTVLLQNVPNPFDQETRIGYILPQTVAHAQLLIFDLQGNQLKNIPVSSRGKDEIVIRASELNAGMYLYTLLADGREVDTKRMILTK